MKVYGGRRRGGGDVVGGNFIVERSIWNFKREMRYTLKDCGWSRMGIILGARKGFSGIFLQFPIIWLGLLKGRD